MRTHHLVLRKSGSRSRSRLKIQSFLITVTHNGKFSRLHKRDARGERWEGGRRPASFPSSPTLRSALVSWNSDHERRLISCALGVSTESGVAGFGLMIKLIVVWKVCPFLLLTRCSTKAIYI